MQIEILSVPGCPHRAVARARLREGLRTCGITAPVREVVVRSPAAARRLHCNGSPTIRIDGKDVAPLPATDRFACRLTPPSSADVLRALREALHAR